MQQVECKIIENNHIIITRNIISEPDLHFLFEMFGGKRQLKITEQYQALIRSNELSNKQEYTLLCSYIKFGQMQQEKKHLKAILKKQI